MPHTLRDHEGVAANGDGNVVMPAEETSSLEVVEPELALHLLVDPLGAVALLEQTHELLFAHLATERGEREFRRFNFAIRPLDDEPDGFTLCGLSSVIVCDLHPAERKPRTELAALRHRSLGGWAGSCLKSEER